MFIVNLENPITLSDQAEEKEFAFRMHPRYVRTLETGRINVVDLANNHTGDLGAQGLDDTVRYFDSAGIHYVGAGRNLKQAREPLVIEKNRERIGFLAYAGADLVVGHHPHTLQGIERYKGGEHLSDGDPESRAAEPFGHGRARADPGNALATPPPQ